MEDPIARRASLFGSLITGFLGIIASLNAMLIDEYVGAGACLIASSLAFAAIGYLYANRPSSD